MNKSNEAAFFRARELAERRKKEEVKELRTCKVLHIYKVFLRRGFFC